MRFLHHTRLQTRPVGLLWTTDSFSQRRLPAEHRPIQETHIHSISMLSAGMKPTIPEINGASDVDTRTVRPLRSANTKYSKEISLRLNFTVLFDCSVIPLNLYFTLYVWRSVLITRIEGTRDDWKAVILQKRRFAEGLSFLYKINLRYKKKS